MERNFRTKNLIKKIQILLGVILLSIMPLSLTGCLGIGEEEPNESTSVVPSDQQITLIWWNLFESQENVQPLIDAYQAKHPNVTIEYSEKTLDEYQTNLDKVLTDGQPATTPDIFTIHNTWIGRYQNYMMAAPSEVTDAATFESSFYPVVYDDVVRDGAPYAIPLGLDSIALIYNKDLLEAKGYTTPSDDWTELLEQAKNLTQKNETTYTKVGLALSADDTSQFWFDTFNLLLMQSQVQMLDAAGENAIFAEDDATAEAIDYFRSYEDDDVWDPTIRQDISLFLEGKLAMFIAPSWRLLDIIKYNEAYDLGIDFGIAPMPQLSSLEEEKAGWADYWVQGVSMDSQYYKVAWDFLNFAAQPDQLRISFDKASESRAFGQMYPRKDMKSEMEENEYLSVYIDEAATAKTWNMVDGEQVKDIFKEMLNNELDETGAESQVSSIVSGGGLLSSL